MHTLPETSLDTLLVLQWSGQIPCSCWSSLFGEAFALPLLSLLHNDEWERESGEAKKRRKGDHRWSPSIAIICRELHHFACLGLVTQPTITAAQSRRLSRLATETKHCEHMMGADDWRHGIAEEHRHWSFRRRAGGLRLVVAHGMLLLMKIAGDGEIERDPRQHHIDPWKG
ncbi:hypothetical protein GGI42DRAFT_102995 [Trichoderma sp. SZMC 28013]